jgi:hypothetical protein
MAATAATARRIGFECSPAEPQRHAGENLIGWRLALSRP